MKNLLCAWSPHYLWPIIFGVILLIGIILFCVLVPMKLWFKTISAKVYISPRKLSSLKARVFNYHMLIDWYIYAKKAGCMLTLEDLETHHGVGGNVKNVVSGLIAAMNAQIHLSVDTAKALDLSGRDVTKIVNEIINYKTVELPVFSAWSSDSLELKVRANVTLKPRVDKLLTGTMEDTIISRVREALICGVSNAKNSKEIMSNFDVITNTILTKHLDKDSAFKLVSVDIINIDIGRDLRHERMMEEKEMEARIAVTKAEEEKELQLVEEQKIKNQIQEKNIEKAEAEAEIPKSIVKAFEEGKLDMLEYWKMQNLIADTNMRKSLVNSFAKPPQEEEKNNHDDDIDDDDDDDEDFDDLF